jgi:hypothetical protein
MAKRPVFLPAAHEDHLVDEIQCEFKWNSGFSATQKKKNILALHESAHRKGLSPLLEVSTKSEDRIGQRLSAFSLRVETPKGAISIESAYQGSKVFEKGGPFIDLYEADSRTAKQDERLRNSGKLQAFLFFEQEWPLVPKTAFYDWLYLSALQHHQEYLKRLFAYKGFTDIEFNPEKSINCQARTCAMLVSLIKANRLDIALSSQNAFIETVLNDSLRQPHSSDIKQASLL